MVPILICIPFISNAMPGYTCFIPNVQLLSFLSALLLILMIPVIILNSIDNSEPFSLAYFLLFLFVCGTLSFVLFGFYGTQKKNISLTTASSIIWCITWTSFLLVCIFSVWDLHSLRRTSINGRCPMTLWLFDWCEQTVHYHRKSMNETEHKSKLDYENYQFSEDNFSSLNYKNDAQGPTKIDLGLTSVDVSKDTGSSVNNTSQLQHRVKRTITETGVSVKYPSGPEYRKFVAYYLAIFFFMLQIIAIYTLYGVVISDIINQLRWRPPIILITEAALPKENDTTEGKQQATEGKQQAPDSRQQAPRPTPAAVRETTETTKGGVRKENITDTNKQAK